MNPLSQRLCAYAGFGFPVFFFIGFWLIGGLIPPMSPTMTTAEVAQFYTAHTWALRAAAAVMMFTAPLGYLWTASVAAQTAQIEGKFPVLSFAQLTTGALTFGGLFSAIVAISTAAFRPDRPAEIVNILNDQFWYWVVMIGSPAAFQGVLIGIAMLSDKSPDPTFPRWLGYLNIWFGVLAIPGATVPFFKTGPFAWDGLFTFWTPAVVFCWWVMVDAWGVLRAVKRRTEAAASPDAV
jgi:hypothetical protein